MTQLPQLPDGPARGGPSPSSDKRESVSCLMDGELDATGTAACIDRLCADSQAREDWMLWHAAGDALRSSEMAAWHSQAFSDRVVAALAGEPTVLAPRASRATVGGRLVRLVLLPGGAVAAAAVMLAVVAWPQLRGAGEAAAVVDRGDVAKGRLANSPANAAVNGQAAAAGGQASKAAESGVVAGELIFSPQLERYFEAHRSLTPASVVSRSATYLRAPEPAAQNGR